MKAGEGRKNRGRKGPPDRGDQRLGRSGQKIKLSHSLSCTTQRKGQKTQGGKEKKEEEGNRGGSKQRGRARTCQPIARPTPEDFKGGIVSSVAARDSRRATKKNKGGRRRSGGQCERGLRIALSKENVLSPGRKKKRSSQRRQRGQRKDPYWRGGKEKKSEKQQRREGREEIRLVLRSRNRIKGLKKASQMDSLPVPVCARRPKCW